MIERIEDEAWQWHRALQGDDADWDGFTLWLEADPRHRAVYDEIALLDDTLDRHRDQLAVILPPETEKRQTRWGAWTGGAIAAALALVVALPMLRTSAPSALTYRTGAGQSRDIALADGSHVVLGPSSRISLSGEEQEQIALQGGAWFDIRHDPDRTMTITAGGQQITDIGTQFDVLSLAGHTRVAVSEGRVSVRPAGLDSGISVPAGRQIAIDAVTHSAILSDVARDDVGSWRTGRLVYQDAPLSLVAADISRYGGKRIKVSPAIAQRRFSGVLTAKDGAGLVVRLQEVTGLEARTEGDSVRLVAGAR